jgi:hypothetical protein
MARKDEILRSFLHHEILVSKYELTEHERNMSVTEALNSEKPIMKSIAMIVNTLEDSAATTDGRLYEMVVQYLNTAAI